MRLWSWNLEGAWQLREEVIEHLRTSGVDIVLAQEARPHVRTSGFEAITSAAGDIGVLADERSYFSAVLHRNAVPISATPVVVPLREATWDQLGVSLGGTISAATVEVEGFGPIILISVYCPWTGPGQTWQRGSGLVISEANAHRVVSDISMLAQVIDHPHDHQILVAGDWNILCGYGENGSDYWAARYATVFQRMEALGFEFCGPSSSDGGRQADPWPDELPHGSRCVPTFNPGDSPTDAKRQIDFVFASQSLSPFVRAKARNEVEEWGPSDHCVIEIEIDSALTPITRRSPVESRWVSE